ncbi:uncharacterized protein LOC128990033 [Macrosteles quadrilineatus]|uniref:uncharacterized protein LOC128990033 n=1 Tax=Macrosteles quadrilineatus TaxID=74068 RepID=UPI0023E0D92A|nr:uncharacterized protein LOC128990033 [Macrosteles quadrilineatus]
MLPTAFVVVLAAILVQVSVADPGNHAGAKPAKHSPFAIASDQEVQKMIAADGFVVASLKKTWELIWGIISAPFRWVYRVFELMITIVKLGIEGVRQFQIPEISKMKFH